VCAATLGKEEWGFGENVFVALIFLIATAIIDALYILLRVIKDQLL